MSPKSTYADYAHSCARELYQTPGKIRDVIIKISDDETKFVCGCRTNTFPAWTRQTASI
jgi:hypothetical protein